MIFLKNFLKTFVFCFTFFFLTESTYVYSDTISESGEKSVETSAEKSKSSQDRKPFSHDYSNLYLGGGFSFGGITSSTDVFGDNPILFGLHSRFGSEYFFQSSFSPDKFYIAVEGFTSLQGLFTQRAGSGLFLTAGFHSKFGFAMFKNDKFKIYSILGLQIAGSFANTGFFSNALSGASIHMNFGIGSKYLVGKDTSIFLEVVGSAVLSSFEFGFIEVGPFLGYLVPGNLAILNFGIDISI